MNKDTASVENRERERSKYCIICVPLVERM
jgi:hypothetical protein